MERKIEGMMDGP